MNEEAIEKTFTVSVPARLSLSNIRGSVVIQPAEDGQAAIHVKAVKHLDTGSPEHTEIEMSQPSDGTVTVKTYYREPGPLSFLVGMRAPCKVDYTVTVPASCSVDLHGVSCSGRVEGLQGEFRLKSVSGRLVASRLTGPLDINTVSGNVDGLELSGPAHLKTVSARVRITNARFPGLSAGSVSGSMSLQTTLGEGPYELSSVSGNMDLSIPAGEGCNLDINRLSGRFRTDLPITRHSLQSYHEEAVIAGGGPPVSFHTTSGNLTVTAYSGELITEGG